MKRISASTSCARGKIPNRSHCSRGEQAETGRLIDRFQNVVNNWFNIMRRQKKLTFFTASFDQVSTVFPYIVVSPAYFAGQVQLGALMQTASAFGSVQSAMSFFVTTYSELAEWGAVIQRLTGFNAAIEQARMSAAPASGIKRVAGEQKGRHPVARRVAAIAERRAAGRRRADRFRHRPQHAADRALGRRQVDAVSRHCRRVAVRARHDRDPARRACDDPAATAVFPGRHAGDGDHLSGASRARSRTTRWRARSRPWACPRLHRG